MKIYKEVSGGMFVVFLKVDRNVIKQWQDSLNSPGEMYLTCKYNSDYFKTVQHCVKIFPIQSYSFLLYLLNQILKHQKKAQIISLREKEAGGDAWHWRVKHDSQNRGLKFVLLTLEQWFPPSGDVCLLKDIGNVENSLVCHSLGWGWGLNRNQGCC